MSSRLLPILAETDARPPRDARIRTACEFVGARPGDDLTLALLASVAGLSPYHFLRIFRSVTGVTPQRYILIVRLERARERLGRTSATVSRIASDLAFANASHLASRFRARYGFTPTEYRRDCIEIGRRALVPLRTRERAFLRSPSRGRDRSAE